jgi:UDP-glucose:(heptosyl)LPS alpha-1,3-glucosyltransferase
MKLAFIKKKFLIHGGAERYLQTLTGHLRKEGHEIHIFANQWAGKEGIAFHKVGVVSLNSFLSTVTFGRNAARAIKKDLEFDCVISFERTNCQDIYRAGEGCHAEWLKIRATIEPLYKKMSFKLNPLHLALLDIERKLFSDTRLIIANSRMVKDQIVRHYSVPEERLATIYNGVDLVRFSQDNRERWRRVVRERLGISDGSKLVLFVGTGFRRKGLGTLIDAISLAKDEDLKVLVIGKDNFGSFRKRAERKGVDDRIVFLGPRKEIEEFYGAADIFVLPTLYDPFSNATLEAMASGLPVVTTKNNGAGELVENGQEGFVVSSLFDALEFSEALRWPLQDLKEMGEKARRKAELFPIERAADEFTEAIKKVNNI